MKPQQSYLDKLLEWQQVRVAIGGKLDIDRAILNNCGFMVNPMYRIYDSVKTEDGTLIPGNAKQVSERQKAYWSRARYLNATRRTTDSLDGMIWSAEPEVVIPSQLEYLNLREAVQKCTYDTISIGRCGVLVDAPVNDGKTVTMAELREGKFNPTMVFYKAEQIPFVRYSGDTLLEVRLIETYEKKVDDKGLEWKQEEQIRRLYLDDSGLYVVEIWRNGEIFGDKVEPNIDSVRLNYIPFQFFGADDNSPEMTDSPLFDIASENLGHYMLSADNRDNLHYHGQGMTNIYTDMDQVEFNAKNPSGLDVGAGGRNLLGQEDRVEILQIQATGAIPEEMLRVEQRMIMLGAQLLQQNQVNQTLGAKEIDTDAQTSTLKRIATNVSLGIENCLQWCANFLRVDGEIKYRLNTRYYTDSLTFQDVQLVWQMVMGGSLPKDALYEISRRKGYTKMTDEELDEKVNDENISGVSEREAELLAQIEELQMQLNGGE